ncbi:hypothetical protein TrVE_jg5515, partial [Triparma verrucosa]
MIGLRTQRSSAPTEGLEDVSAFPGPSKITSAREMEADKGDVSGTEERRNVDAREDKGVCTAPQGLQCAEKRTELESEELLKLGSKNVGSGDVLTFSGPSETIPVKEITADESDVFFTEENTNAGKRNCVKRVIVDPPTVSNEGTGAVITASGLSEMIPEKEIDADSSDVFRPDEKYHVANSGEGDRAHTDSLTVLDEDPGDVTASSNLSKPIPEKVNVSTEHGESNVTGYTKIDNNPFLAKLSPLLLENAILCSAITAPGCEAVVEEHPVDVHNYVEQAANVFTELHAKKFEWTTITPRSLGGDSTQGTPRGLSREGEPLKNNAGSASNSFAALCEGEAMEDRADFYSKIDLERIRSLRGQQVKTKKKARSSTKKVDADSRDVFSIDEKYCVVNFGEGVTTSSGFSETRSEKKINTDSSDVSHTDEIYRSDNAGKSERVKRVGVYPITVSNEGTEDVTTSFGLSEMILEEQISADGSEHFNACLQYFGNNAEPKTKKRYKTKRRSLFKKQLHTSRWVFMALILLSLLGHVNADAPASGHGWDFRNCATGQDVLDTGDFHSSMGSGVPVGADGEQESCRQKIDEGVRTSTKSVDSDRYSSCNLLDSSECHYLNKSDADETDARCSETAWALGQHVLSTPMCCPHLPQNGQVLSRPQSQKPDLKYTLESSVLLSLLPASKLEPNNVKSTNDAQAGCKVSALTSSPRSSATSKHGGTSVGSDQIEEIGEGEAAVSLPFLLCLLPLVMIVAVFGLVAAVASVPSALRGFGDRKQRLLSPSTASTLFILLLLTLLLSPSYSWCEDVNTPCDATRCVEDGQTFKQPNPGQHSACGTESCGKGNTCTKTCSVRTSYLCSNRAGYDTDGTECAAGKYSTQGNACTACEAGKASSTTGATSEST